MTKLYTAPNRRKFLAGAAGLIAAPYVISATARAQNKTLFVNTWGGSWTAAEDAAFFKGFTEATGAKIQTVTPVSYAKLKAQVDSGNYEWDVTSISQTQLLRAKLENLIEPIDYKIIDKNKLPPDAVFSDGISYCVLSYNVAYRSDKYKDGAPQTWADFWDVKKFPGTRSMYGGDAVIAVLQALLADGVDPKKMYPADVDRAFKKLDQIKQHVKIWWTQGNQSQQLFRDGEIDMMAIWNARASELKLQGTPVDLAWVGALNSITMWAVAKGAPNKGLAWEFIQYAVQAQPQAEFAKRLFYGPTNPKSYDFLSEDVAKQLPTYPKYLDAALILDPTWGGQNASKIEERFKQWQAS